MHIGESHILLKGKFIAFNCAGAMRVLSATAQALGALDPNLEDPAAISYPSQSYTMHVAI